MDRRSVFVGFHHSIKECSRMFVDAFEKVLGRSGWWSFKSAIAN
jgi:hypothetical protein